jgi:hypothetical protein
MLEHSRVSRAFSNVWPVEVLWGGDCCLRASTLRLEGQVSLGDGELEMEVSLAMEAAPMWVSPTQLFVGKGGRQSGDGVLQIDFSPYKIHKIHQEQVAVHTFLKYKNRLK